MDPVTIAMMAAGLSQTVGGLIGQGKEKANAARLAAARPKYEASRQIVENQQITESRASQGLSDSTKQLFTTNAQRGLTASLDAILRGGGSVNDVGNLYDSYSGGLNRMAMAEDEMKFRNINNYLAANTALAGENEKAWQINTFAPWADQMQLSADRKAAADKNVSNGMNAFMSAGISGFMGGKNPGAGLFKSQGVAKVPQPYESPIQPATTQFFGSNTPNFSSLGQRSIGAIRRLGVPLLASPGASQGLYLGMPAGQVANQMVGQVDYSSLSGAFPNPNKPETMWGND